VPLSDRRYPESLGRQTVWAQIGWASWHYPADHVLGFSEHPHVMSGLQVRWAKIAFERVFAASRKRGRVVR